MALLAALGTVMVVLGVYLPRTGRDVVAERLSEFKDEIHTLEDLELQQPFSERILRPFIRQLADMAARMPKRRQKDTTQKVRVSSQEAILRKLQLAGNPYNWTPSDYMGTKVLAAVGLGGLLFFLLTVGGSPGMAVLLGVVGVLMGWFGPDLLLRSRTQARQKAIQRALPDALDLLVISVEAGLGFDAAIQRMVEKRDDPLTREFARVLAEMRVGRARREALKDMVARTNVPDLNNFVNAVMQAEMLGVSVTRVLTVQADQMRTLRRQRAEEKAAQLQLKMIFPLAFFIFPALCIVILGPIWPTVARVNAPGL